MDSHRKSMLRKLLDDELDFTERAVLADILRRELKKLDDGSRESRIVTMIVIKLELEKLVYEWIDGEES